MYLLSRIVGVLLKKWKHGELIRKKSFRGRWMNIGRDRVKDTPLGYDSLWQDMKEAEIHSRSI